MKNVRFRTRLSWDGKSGAEVSIGNYPHLKLDMPIRFGGRGRYPCPDELFLSSIAGCLLTTFLYFKRKLEVNVQSFNVSVTGRLVASSEGYRIGEIRATMFAKVKKSDVARLRRCIQLAKEYCHITRSLEKAFRVRMTEKVHVV